LQLTERWRSKLLTAKAMAALGAARLLIATTPFARWRDTLGGAANHPTPEAALADALRFARHVEWAAKLLPFSTKCLPRAMALSWMLRSARIGHAIIFAVRPAAQRRSDDQPHAWVEIAGETIIGDLPGPWVETLRLGNT
jgi:hypothetical protein